MFTKLFLLFLLVPVIEIYLLLKVGSLMGAMPTVAVLLAISLAGAWLVRHQGFIVLQRIQTELAQGRLPASELMDGALILIGGVLLLTPGFFTDFLGIFFIFPPTRILIKRLLGQWLQRRLSRGNFIIRTRF
ncbi:cytoplasmic membrane protein FxsA [Geotalea daltonii FRC-32]|uniref:Cytoplasmic membrane protein FxsA n=1 Tax=Geotalea daltonii (strain DSM 22248 / JCM 15807 / FRC-32) TaxID=316067 RepID=B9M818_GEODF|nr:FxsA family protein [Geotalea daltonii]ACM20284.1 cytoplasmic membrane protein FxsA [Geotalea daltonii FRC-32]